MPHTPVTSAPYALAICTANVPTPPDAPLTSTVRPARTPATSRRPMSAVLAASGIAADCSKVRPAGLRSTAPSATHTNSAKAPSASPYTSSPGASPTTAPPTASTTPAKSRPRTAAFGLRSPNAARAIFGSPCM